MKNFSKDIPLGMSIIIILSFFLFFLFLLLKINFSSFNIQIPNSNPFQIIVTMPNDAMHERNFSWHTTKGRIRSDLELVNAEHFKKDNAFLDSSKVIRFNGKISKTARFDSYTHKVKATKLKPGTRYYYRVGDRQKGIWSDTGEFKTDDGDANFKFIYISDSQSYVEEEKQSTYAVEQAKKTVSDAEFIVNTGDFVNDSCDVNQWRKNLNFNVYGDITTVASVGNHDYNYNCNSDYSFINNFYYDIPKQNTKSGVFYSFNYGNVHFVVLNTNYDYYSKLNKNQLKWLIKDLNTSSAKKAKYRIVLMHRGVYTTGPHYYEHKDILPLTKQLTSVMADNNVDLVLQGHDHVYSLTYPIDRNGNVSSINYKQIYSKETNSSVNAMLKKDPIYFIGDSIGPKHLEQSSDENDTYLTKFQIRTEPSNSKKERYGVFSSIEINNNDLIVNSYTIDNINYGKVELYKSFALTK